MSSRSSVTRLAGKRTSAIAAITAVVAATGSVLAATPAAALTSEATISFAPASLGTNHPAGSPATLTVNYTPTSADAPIRMIIFSGPDAASAPNPTGVGCAAPAAGTTTCMISNTNPGTDAVEVYADNNSNGTFDAGDIASATTTVTFSGTAASVTIAPSSTRSTAGTCVLYTLHATDSLGQPVVGRTFTLTVSETASSFPATISVYDSPPPPASPNCDTPTSTSGTQNSNPVSGPAAQDPATDANGTIVFGVSASAPGTGSIHVTADMVTLPATPGSVNTSASTVWTAGGADSVTSLAIAAPANVTQYTGTTASFAITATDHDGDPVQGVPVNAESDSLLDVPATPCGTTNHLGQVTCTLTNAGAAGTDTLTYWVNYDSALPGPHTAGPDPDEAQVRATAIFRSPPAFTLALATLKCVDQLANDKNLPSSSCTVPTTQQSVTFTETLVYQPTPTSPITPVAGAVIQFDVPSATLAGNNAATVATQFVTTDANGTATFTVSDPNAATNDVVSVNSHLGVQFLNNAHAHWQTPAAGSITLTPPLQTVTKGSPVSVGVQIADQFGSPVTGTRSIFYSLIGPSAPQAATISTNSAGAAVISYTSNATLAGEDQLTVDDISEAGVLPETAYIELINGSTSAATVTVDTSGNGTAATCPSTGTPQNTNLVIGSSNTEVCAIVKNAGGEVLSGKTVTFTVDVGQVAGTTPVPAASTKTYTATTGRIPDAGIAIAYVSSTKSGTQTVTATADSASGSGTLSYALPTVDKARNIVISPVSATITAGGQQKFTWTVTDQYANPIAGATITYTQVGPGLPGGTSSGALLTAPDGTASIVISTSGTDNGAGSVVGTIQQPAPPTPVNQCTDPAGAPVTATTAGNCTAAATYTVVSASPPTSLALHVASGVKKGHQETVTATVKNADGSPSANQVVRFLVTGANGLIGSAPTNAAGVATFTYVATHAGTDAISAYDDINNDQLQESNEPGHHTKAVIGGVTDKPTIHLTTFHASVTVHVATHPAMPHVLVTYYVKRYGKFVKIGTSRAGTLGRASHIFFFPKGVVRTFKARVNTKQGIKGAKTHAATITVR